MMPFDSGHNTAAEYEAAREYVNKLRAELTENGTNKPGDPLVHFVVRFAEIAFLAGLRHGRENRKA